MARSSGAHQGDLVGARSADRSGERVEGLLAIRYVPALDYIQVTVGDTAVDASTVTVVQRGVATPDAMDDEDTLRRAPGWRRYHDLDAAVSTGLVPPPRTRTGGTWAQMGARLDVVIAPMLAAGWTEVPDARSRDYDTDAGDLLGYSLTRGDAHLEVALRQDGVVCVWDLGDDADAGDTEYASPALLVIEPEGLPAEATARGWLDPFPGCAG